MVVLDRVVPVRPSKSDAVPYALYLWTYFSSVLALAAFFGLPAAALWGALGMGTVALPLLRSLLARSGWLTPVRAGRGRRAARWCADALALWPRPALPPVTGRTPAGQRRRGPAAGRPSGGRRRARAGSGAAPGAGRGRARPGLPGRGAGPGRRARGALVLDDGSTDGTGRRWSAA